MLQNIFRVLKLCSKMQYIIILKEFIAYKMCWEVQEVWLKCLQSFHSVQYHEFVFLIETHWKSVGQTFRSVRHGCWTWVHDTLPPQQQSCFLGPCLCLDSAFLSYYWKVLGGKKLNLYFLILLLWYMELGKKIIIFT